MLNVLRQFHVSMETGGMTFGWKEWVNEKWPSGQHIPEIAGRPVLPPVLSFNNMD